MTIGYKPRFIKKYNKLPQALKEEAKEKIALFSQYPNHAGLKVHKLKGKLKGQLSFSVNYAYRIMFFYEDKDKVVLLDIGDHSVYD